MIKKGKKVDKKPLSESNVKNVSSNVAKKVITDKKSVEIQNIVTEAKLINTKKAFFKGTAAGGKKKSLLFLASAIIFSISLASFFVFFRNNYYADAENWPIVDTSTGLRAKPAELLIREGKLQRPSKVVIIDLEYDQNSSVFRIDKVSRKNGYIKNTLSGESRWRAELQDGSGTALKEAFFSRDNAYVESEEGTSETPKIISINKSSLTLPWVDGAEKVTIFNPSGELIQEEDIKNVKHIDNKPDFYSVTGKEIQSKKKTTIIDNFNLTEKASASLENGVVDIVVIPQGFSSAEMSKFDQKFSIIKDAFQNVEPFKSRFSSIRFNRLKDVPDFSCKGPGISGSVSQTFMYCNWRGGDWVGYYSGTAETSIKTYLESRAVPYDRVLVVKNNDLEKGGTGSFPENGWTSIITTIDSKMVNLALHEIAHTFGAYDEYVRAGKVYTQNTSLPSTIYEVVNPSPNTVAANCFTGPPTGDFKFSGCGTYTNWSRTSLNSTMNNYPDIPNFNPITQKIILRYMDKLIDSTPPSVSIISSGGSTVQAASIPTSFTTSVGASDNRGIASVELFVDGVSREKKTSAPYDFTWDPSIIRQAGRGLISAGTTYTLQITGIANITNGTGFIAANLTVLNPASNGYMVAYPCDGARPATSSINFRASEITNGAIFTKLSSSGTICLFSSAAANVIVDVNGYYPLGAEYTSLPSATRIIDTRTNGDGINKAGNTKTVKLGEVAGVPLISDAVNLRVTVTGASTAGELTLYPCDLQRPLRSNMAYPISSANSTMSLARLSKTGTICIYTTTDAHIILDVEGYMSSTGKYLAASSYPNISSGTKISAVTDQALNLNNSTSGYVLGSKGINGIVTVLSPAEGGNLLIYQCDKSRTTGSTINYVAGKTKSTVFISGISSSGTICIYSSKSVNIDINAMGYFGPTSSFIGMTTSRLLDTRSGVIIQNSFQFGTHRIVAKATDLSGLVTSTVPLDIKF